MAMPPQPMPAQPAEAPEPQSMQMGMSDAMDVLDEFHIKRSDIPRVMEALETVMGPEDEASEATTNDASGADVDVAKQMFATGRDRKAM